MICKIWLVLVFVASLLVAGCGSTGPQSSNNGDWFKQQDERVSRMERDHMRKDAKAVRDYDRRMNP